MKKIGKEQVRKARQTLAKYKEGKAVLDKRIVSNEQWWKLRHWGEIGYDKDDTRPMPASAWLFNSLANKHADAMDNIPEPAVLPREKSDEEVAKQLSLILPAILERCGYEKLYSDGWWYKLKNGSMCTAVVWDPDADGGMGDIAIRNVDILNLFWEPGIKDIEESANLFYVTLVDRERLNLMYPELLGEDTESVAGGTENVEKYKTEDKTDDSAKVEVVDWYYKKTINGRKQLCYCKFCGDRVIYSSEDDESCADGFYKHSRYPFVMDTLFVQEGTPCGFGYIDVMRDAQMYIDKLSQVVLEHTVMMSRKRFFIRQNSAVNEAEFADLKNRFVHVAGNLGDEDIREIKAEPLDSSVMKALSLKIDELKETSGNRDFSQGSVSNGVTAASAIAALQEAGSKLSRDMLKSAYRAFARECYLIIDLMRQFYDEERVFRVVGPAGGREFVPFSGAALRARPMGVMGGVELGSREPVFDIVVSAEKKSTFSRLSQNETAKECYQLGFFAPQNADAALAALEMMDFEGIEKVRQRVRQNGTLAQKLTAAQMQIARFHEKLSGAEENLSTRALAKNLSGALRQLS